MRGRRKRIIWGSAELNSAEESEGKNDSEPRSGKCETIGNRIFFYQQVTQESMLDLVQKIRELEESILVDCIRWEAPGTPIHLHINSYGGEVFAALGAVDHIRACRVPVYTYIDGSAASAATLISVCGHRRFMYPNSFMLIHQISSGFWGKYEEWKDENQNLEILMDKLKELYKKFAKVPHKDLLDILKHDLWLDPEKCVQWGLVDAVKQPDPLRHDGDLASFWSKRSK